MCPSPCRRHKASLKPNSSGGQARGRKSRIFPCSAALVPQLPVSMPLRPDRGGISMALSYDFDIFRIIPDLGPSDLRLAGLLNQVGAGSTDEAATVALFRDPRTATALRRAAPTLRKYLLDSGFGLNTYTSGAPAGCYPADDEDERLALILRLAENAPCHDFPHPENTAEGGDAFCLGEFLLALDQAQPLDGSGADFALPDAIIDHRPVSVAPQHRILPPLFETEPLAGGATKISTRQKFWQSRAFRIGATAVLVLGAIQMGRGPALTVIASL